MRVLIEKSHQVGPYTGAPEEKNYIAALCSLIDALCQGSGIQTFWINGDLQPTDTDATIIARHFELKSDYDAFIALHYDADIYRNPAGDHLSGWFWDRAETSATADRDDALGAIFERRYKALSGVPEFHPERRNANTRNYWLFRNTSDKTPGIIIELGVGAPNAPDHDWLRNEAGNIAQTIKQTLMEFGGITTAPAPKPMPAPLPEERSEFPALGVQVLGATSLRYLRLLSQLTALNPDVPMEIIDAYSSLAPRVGIRAEVALAQAMHETGMFKFPGRAQFDWHNPAGIGVGANAIPGKPNSSDSKFPTWEEGVRAHLGKLLQYFGGPDHITGFCDKDPRHGTHKLLPNDVAELSGRWAVPGIKTLPDGTVITYGGAIAKLLSNA